MMKAFDPNPWLKDLKRQIKKYPQRRNFLVYIRNLIKNGHVFDIESYVFERNGTPFPWPEGVEGEGWIQLPFPSTIFVVEKNVRASPAEMTIVLGDEIKTGHITLITAALKGDQVVFTTQMAVIYEENPKIIIDIMDAITTIINPQPTVIEKYVWPDCIEEEPNKSLSIHDYRTLKFAHVMGFIGTFCFELTYKKPESLTYVVEESEPPAARKRMKEVRHKQMSIITLKPVVEEQREPLGGTHASPCKHWRRGHWRRVGSGKKVWIKPVLVKEDDPGPVLEQEYRVAT